MPVRLTSTVAVLMAVFSGWATSAAQDTVRIGGVELPADYALARKEHPRLLLTRAKLPRLRGRLKHPRIAAELEHARQLAAEKKAGAILLAITNAKPFANEEGQIGGSPIPDGPRTKQRWSTTRALHSTSAR